MAAKQEGSAVMGSRRFAALAVALLGIVLTIGIGGCGGGDDAPGGGNVGRVASMVALPDEGDAAPDAAGPAAITAIELDPKRPVAGSRIRARARFGPGSGPKPEVAYHWRTASGRELGTGRDLDTAGLDPESAVEVVASTGEGEEPFVHRFRLAAEASQISLVLIDTREGKSVGSRLRAVVETTDESEGFDAFEIEWRVAGQRVGDEEELDTTPLAAGDVVELRSRVAGESERGGWVHAEPLVLERSASPQITSKPRVVETEGEFRYSVEATSPVPGAALRFELLEGPDGMTIDPATGVVRWRPAAGQRGRFDVEVAVMDQWGSGVAQSFAIQSNAPESPPASPQ